MTAEPFMNTYVGAEAIFDDSIGRIKFDGRVVERRELRYLEAHAGWRQTVTGTSGNTGSIRHLHAVVALVASVTYTSSC